MPRDENPTHTAESLPATYTTKENTLSPLYRAGERWERNVQKNVFMEFLYRHRVGVGRPITTMPPQVEWKNKFPNTHESESHAMQHAHNAHTQKEQRERHFPRAHEPPPTQQCYHSYKSSYVQKHAQQPFSIYGTYRRWMERSMRRGMRRRERAEEKFLSPRDIYGRKWVGESWSQRSQR